MKRLICGLWCMLCLSANAEFDNIQLTGTSSYCGEPSIAVNGTLVGIAYESYFAGNDEIFLLTSSNGGGSFSTPIQVTSNDSSSWRPKIAVNDGYDLVWEDKRSGKREIYYARYASGALGTTLKISGGNIYSAFPSLANDGRDLFITWEDYRNGNDEIYFRKNVGGVWSAEKRLTDNDSTSWGSDIALDPVTKALHVVFFDYRTGNDEVYYITSTDKGESWSSPINLSQDAANSWEPRITAYGGRVGVVWYSWDDATTSYEVYFSENTGGGFSVPQRISETGSDSKCPAIQGNEEAFVVAWEDYRDANDEIYLARKGHATGGWSSLRVTVDSSDSFGADVAFCGAEILIPWFDYRSGTDQIWFAKGVFEGGTSCEKRKVPNPVCQWLNINPNPSSGYVGITVGASGINPDLPIQLEVFNPEGRLVYHRAGSASIFKQGMQLNTAQLAAGRYLVRVSGENNFSQARVFIIH